MKKASQTLNSNVSAWNHIPVSILFVKNRKSVLAFHPLGLKGGPESRLGLQLLCISKLRKSL